MRGFKKYGIAVFFMVLGLTCKAQFSAIEVQAYLNKDSVVLGEPFIYSISITYPSQYEAIFPDSNYIQSPLEWISKNFSNTVCKGNLCTDSIQYTLRTFSTDSMISPNIPVFVFGDNHHDTLFIHPEPKRIVIKKLNTANVDYAWQEDLMYLQVPDSINYWYYGLITSCFLFVMGLLYWIAGPYVLRRIKRFNLDINHKRYIKELDEQIQVFSTQKKASDLEKCVTIWKSYLTKLEGKPYTTLTTKELNTMQDMEDVITPLQNLDRFLYGGLRQNESMESLNALRRFSNKRFLKKKKELRNAR
jgi:hypothetical protein